MMATALETPAWNIQNNEHVDSEKHYFRRAL
jgi:hypothetical protein